MIPCELPDGTHISYTLQMYLNCEPPIAAGREIWGFPKKYAHPSLVVDGDTLVGQASYGSFEVACGTMAYKHEAMTESEATGMLTGLQCNLKLIGHVDHSPRIAQLIQYRLSQVSRVRGWRGPCRLALHEHVGMPMAVLPVKRILEGIHLKADITLPYGEVLHDYLATPHTSQQEDEAQQQGCCHLLSSPIPASCPLCLPRTSFVDIN